MGRITCRLFDKQAPQTVANFIGLAEGTKDWSDPTTHDKEHGKPLYDGTIFHRVIPGFMAQGGDPMGTGMGDPGYYIPDEIDPSLMFDVPGRLAMANSGPNTDGSQFFVTEDIQPSLNGHYTIFGQCDPSSVLVVKTMTRVERDGRDKPLTPVVLKKVTIVPVGQPVPPPPACSAECAASHGSCTACPCAQAQLIPSYPRGRRLSPGRPANRHKGDREMSRTPGTYATLKTSEGTIVCRLFEKEAPKTVANFIELAEGKREWSHPTTRAKSTDKLYDGTIFHRVIPDFMIQGGDPAGTGMGGPGYKFEDETKGSAHRFDKPGKLAMANAGPNTNGSQFFITTANTEWLTGKHTIFGEVVEGQDIAEKISRLPRGAQDKPKTPVVLESVTIERVA